MNTVNFKQWTPVIDGQFLLDDPLTTLTGQWPSKAAQDIFNGVDLVIGANNNDGSAYLDASKTDYSKSEINDTFIPDLAAYMSLNGKATLPSAVGDAILLEYADRQKVCVQAFHSAAIPFWTDIRSSVPLSVPIVAIHDGDLVFYGREWIETYYQFPEGMNITVTEEQRNIGRAFTTMWANYIKTGYGFNKR